jgi:hypothetical protein
MSTTDVQSGANDAQLTGLRKLIHDNIVSSIGSTGTGFSQGLSTAPSPTAFCQKSDSVRFGLVKFGMERSLSAGCCITRFTGGKSGCCGGIASGKPFEREYIKAIERHIEKHKEMPELDPKVVEKLKELQEHDRLKALAKTTKQIHSVAIVEVKSSKPKPTQSRLITFLQAPFRWLKWLVIGFWEDLKQMLAARRT